MSQNTNRLFEAIIDNNYNVVQNYFYFSINKTHVNIIYDVYKNTLLHIAIQNKRYDIVKLLLSLNANIDSVNKFNETPLDCAIKNNDVKIIKMIIEHQVKNYPIVKAENEKLKSDIVDLKYNNSTLITDLNTFRTTNRKLLSENSVLVENNKILRSYETLKTVNNNLIIENNELRNSNTSLNNELITTRLQRKRALDDNGILFEENKRLKTDIITYQDMLKNK